MSAEKSGFNIRLFLGSHFLISLVIIIGIGPRGFRILPKICLFLCYFRWIQPKISSRILIPRFRWREFFLPLRINWILINFIINSCRHDGRMSCAGVLHRYSGGFGPQQRSVSERKCKISILYAHCSIIEASELSYFTLS